MTDFVGDAVGQRMAGGTPSRFKSVGVAIVIGVGAAMLAYRLLRSNKSDSDDSDDSQESPESSESDDDSEEPS